MALISVAEALDQVLAHAAPLAPETVPIGDALGRVLAADLKALRTQPPADMSAMDGYAVRASDVANVPARLRVIGEVAAGRPFTATVGTGEAARIFTGGVIPGGADTIVIQEITERAGDAVTVLKSASKSRNIRRQGLDFRRGDTLFTAGHWLTRARSGAARRHEPSDRAGASPARKWRCLQPATNWCRPGKSPGRDKSSIPTVLRLPRWRAGRRRHRRSRLVKDKLNRPSRLFALRANGRPTFW